MKWGTITFVDGTAAPRCAHGHEVRTLKARAVDHWRPQLVVIAGRVFGSDWQGGRPPGETDFRLDGDGLLVTRRYCVPPAPLPQGVMLAGECRSCSPVLVEVKDGFAGLVEPRYPELEYVLGLDGDRVAQLHCLRVETRDEVRRRHPGAIADSDTLVSWLARSSEPPGR